MSTAKIDNVIGSYLPIPVIEHATDSEVYTATAAQTVFTTTKFDRSNAIRVIAKSSGGAFSEVAATWTGVNTVTISGTILGAGQIVYIFKVGTHASKIRIQNGSGAWVDLSSYTSSLALKGANSDITELNGLTKQITTAQGGVGKGYIDGFRLVYTGRTSITINPGAAYVNGKIIEMTADKVITGLTSLVATTFYHVYVYDNAGVADIEISSVVPERYYNTAFRKTGDSSRRYLGSFLTSTTSLIWAFRHEIGAGRMMYNEGQPGVAPFPFILGFSTAGAVHTTSNATIVVPKETALTVTAIASGSSSMTLSVSPADQLTPMASPNWDNLIYLVTGQAVGLEIPLSRTLASLGQFSLICAAAVTLYARGYTFER